MSRYWVEKERVERVEHSGRVIDSRLRGCGFKPYQHQFVVSLIKTHNLCFVLVHTRKTRPGITEKWLTGT